MADVIKFDWREITTTSLHSIFEAWSNDSALQQMGLGDCMQECAPRRRAVREQLDPIVLYVWNLRQLAQEHVRSHCVASNAWRLSYNEYGRVRVPPLRITAGDIVPLTEHEANVLHRRPHFAQLLYRDFMQRHSAAEQPASAEGEAVAPTSDGFHDDRSILSNLTPDYDSDEEAEHEDSGEEQKMDVSE